MEKQKAWAETSGLVGVGRYWVGFAKNHPRAAKLLEQFVKFYLISLLVTVMQYILLTFMPALFARLTDWETTDCYLIPILNTGKYIFQFSVEAGGMAYFAGYGVTLLAAQCVNFPMQRNITFRSTGNLAYQIFWYIIAFALIFMVCSGLQTFYQPLLQQYIAAPARYNILITVINGGVQMVIYFPIYKIVFPEGEAGSTEIL